MIALVFFRRKHPDNVFPDGEDTFRQALRREFGCKEFWIAGAGAFLLAAGIYLLMRIEA
jgi:hypothetical protein